ncbi:hypothetical protein LXL04_001619 [Taraxacum kok-saghyz]
MNLEKEVLDEPTEINMVEDIDTNSNVDSGFECEEITDAAVNIGYDEDESNDDSIIGKGLKEKKANRSCGETKKQRRDLRTGCEAMLRVSKRKDGKWFVDKFNDAHNHELSITPTKVMKHRSHRKFHRSLACKSLMVELGKSGLQPSQIKKAVNAMKAPYEPDVTSKQCVDILSEQRRKYKDKEFYGLIKHFQDKTIVDVDQYFVVDLFENGSPRNVFWADGRSREAYTKFGDKHELKHIGPLVARYSDFQESYRKWVKSDTVEEFEAAWEFMRGKYNIDNKHWITEMFNQRKHWVKAYLKDAFFAGMTTSGRNESIHSFFDGFVNSKTMFTTTQMTITHVQIRG